MRDISFGGMSDDDENQFAVPSGELAPFMGDESPFGQALNECFNNHELNLDNWAHEMMMVARVAVMRDQLATAKGYYQAAGEYMGARQGLDISGKQAGPAPVHNHLHLQNQQPGQAPTADDLLQRARAVREAPTDDLRARLEQINQNLATMPVREAEIVNDDDDDVDLLGDG